MSDHTDRPTAKPGPGSSRRIRRRTSSKRTGARSGPPDRRAQPRPAAQGPHEPRDSYDLAEGSKDADHGVRALVGAGPSQIPRIAAMRTRDINRPTAEEIAAAEADVEIIRRNWKPPTP